MAGLQCLIKSLGFDRLFLSEWGLGFSHVALQTSVYGKAAT